MNDLKLAIELFSQLYQVLGAHDASEKVMDVVSDAASGEFYEVDLLPYVCPDVHELQQRLEAAERERDEASRSLDYVKERNKQIEQLYNRNNETLCKLIDELSQSNSLIKEFKAALSKIHGECIDVLFDFAARRDDRRLALPIHQQAPEVQEAIAVFYNLLQQLNGGE